MARKPKATATTERIRALLRLRHSGHEWARFEELRNGTGWQQQDRYIDFFALNVWPSKGFRSVAYEIKVSRSDFARELKNPAKRAFAERHAMECWIAAPVGMIKPEELPEGWGLIEATAGGLRTKRHAMQRKPEPWPMAFIASMARKASAPEESLPAEVWNVHGMQLARSEMLMIAECVHGRAVEAAERNVAKRERQDPQSMDRDGLAAKVRSLIGWRIRTAKDFEDWYRSVRPAGPVSGDGRRKIRAAITALQEMLDD